MPKREKPLVTKNVPAFIARTQFGQILERVSEEGERILVTKTAKPKP
jgi:prevent-host-death family protein